MDPEDHGEPAIAVQPDYGTEPMTGAPAAETAWVEHLAAHDHRAVRHDVRLDRLAEHVALMVDAGVIPTARELDLWATAVGTPYVPFAWVCNATPEAIVASFDALPGGGPASVGLASRGGSVVLVAARAWFTLPAPVAKSGDAPLVFQVIEPFEPELVVASREGVERRTPTAIGKDPMRFEVGPNLSGTVVELVGRPAPVAAADRTPLARNTASSTFGVLHFDGARTAELASTEQEALARVRAAMHQPRLRWVVDPHVDCDSPPPVEVGGQAVMLEQTCLSLPVAGTASERGAMLTRRATVLEPLADPRWEIAELDVSSPAVVNLRLYRPFVPRDPAEVRDDLLARMAKSWPDSKPSELADPQLEALLERWSATPVLTTQAAFGDELAVLASHWSPGPRYFRALVATQDPAQVLDLVTPDAAPLQHALAVRRGVGPRGEPLYLCAVILATP